MYYYLSFLRGQDRENRIPAGSESLYLSTEFSGMCMRKGEQGTVITGKPILPSEEEMESNSRAKSAKLRIFEKCN